MKYLVSFTIFALLFSLSCVSQSQSQVEDKDYIVGVTDINLLNPTNVTFIYKSKLFKNEMFRVEYRDATQSFNMYKNNENIVIPDAIFSDLKISSYAFQLQEYKKHSGTDALPLKCQALLFDLIDHALIYTGRYKMCETETAVLILQSKITHPLDELMVVYDSSISDEVHPDGFWEEVTDIE